MNKKDEVRAFWQRSACGEELLLQGTDQESFAAQSRLRYELEPFIEEFARFEETRGLSVLEIGVGLGADHERFVKAGARTIGIDLTERAIKLTSMRLAVAGLMSDLRLGDGEALDFSDNSFDLVYSWGVIHHSPKTDLIVAEIERVLKPGGRALVMIYSKWSIVGLMLWFRYALLKGKPFTSLKEIYAKYLESPGTKAYTESEARALFSAFEELRVRTVLCHGDLLSSGAGQRHSGRMLETARRIWPRWFISRFLKKWGLFMLIEARKADYLSRADQKK